MMEGIDSTNSKVAIIGLGYVGLPTAIAFHEAGFDVTGLDIDQEVISSLSRGFSHLSDSTAELIIPVDSGRWKVCQEYSKAVSGSKLVIITVPTPTHYDKSPNLKFVEESMDSVMQNIDRGSGTAIVLESTVYPGVTREVACKKAEKYGLINGVDFHLAYSPERISPGDIGKSSDKVARIIGSEDEGVGRHLASVYSKITTGGCTYVGNIEVAEAAKMVENTQRDIDIAFVNELAKTLPLIGLDVMEVLAASNTKWNFHYHEPGIGVGGHCIPIDPYYYIEICRKAGLESEISPISRKINESMPAFAATLLYNLMGGLEQKKILILGYSYKPGLGDVRETPVRVLAEKLKEMGAIVIFWDPHVKSNDFPEWGEVAQKATSTECDIVVLGTSHEECISLDWEEMLSFCSSKILFDGRRSLDKSELEEIGWKYQGVGVN